MKSTKHDTIQTWWILFLYSGNLMQILPNKINPIKTHLRNPAHENVDLR